VYDVARFERAFAATCRPLVLAELTRND